MIGTKETYKTPKIAIDDQLLKTFKNIEKFDSRVSEMFFVMFIDAIESVKNEK
jgi:hypothetical protein